jgi:DNA polymerase III alpha subunit
MICRADTIGVFQIESRAQMSMLPRLRPRCYYDLVIEVAIVRPGPIQGDMVHPYLRRRNGEEPVSYPGEAVRKVLAKTLGVPLFQEQAMALAIVAAGFTPGEADELRRAMAAWKRKGNQIEQFGQRLIAGMLERGYERSFAERCFQQIKGFSEYGFPESHAASFALLVYVSAWLKRHHPAAFAAALLNSQPMGFYAPSQIVRDAQEHGVEVRGVDVGLSRWDCTLEERHEGENRSEVSDPSCLRASVPPCLRLGMRLVKGLREEDAEAIAGAVAGKGPFGSWPGPMRSRRWVSTGSRRCGRFGDCATSVCRCSSSFRPLILAARRHCRRCRPCARCSTTTPPSICRSRRIPCRSCGHGWIGGTWCRGRSWPTRPGILPASGSRWRASRWCDNAPAPPPASCS